MASSSRSPATHSRMFSTSTSHNLNIPPTPTTFEDSPMGSSDPQRPVTPQKSPPPVTWMSLPKKDQLAILALVRVVDFFQVACLQAYMFHQLKSFAPDLTDSKISFQAGVMQGGFTSAQTITAILWGRIADASWSGRKRVILIGLLGTGISCVGVGYSRSFVEACAWRIFGGAVNGTVGAARTMIAEAVDKRYHARAFLLLPAAFNVANILGPSEYKILSWHCKWH